ncbi:MAG TPA: cysteine desulfurase NifS [Candidatus Acidoferrales bacterium]
MRVYLDYNATTPVAPEVLEAMLPYFTHAYGNASSIHSPGQEARSAVEDARESVASLIGGKPAEIVFTSGGTEADNLAIFGIVAGASAKRHVITSAIEHHAVLHGCEKLQSDGVDVTFLPVGSDGIVEPDEVRRALRPETALISVMHANNELGTIQPIEEIGAIAREADVYFHTDAVQTAGKLPIDVNRLGVDLLSLSAHKIYGPKGTGALFVKSGTRLEPLFFGGHHERDRRPGTENVAGIVGMGRAAAIAARSVIDEASRIAELRDRLENSLLTAIPQCRVNGRQDKRTANTSNMTFSFAEGESLVIALDLRGVACSTGAACSSGAVEPSHVLKAIGLPPEDGRSSIRFSLGRETSADEIEFALDVIPAAVEHLRELSPAYSPADGKTAPVR